MNERRVYLLIGLAIVVIGSAIWVASQRHLPRDVDVGNKVLPDFKAGELTEIDVVKAGARRAVTLEIKDNEWTVAERDHYPADASRVRGLVLGIVDLRIIEEKTSDPKNYSAIGVEDISQPAAGGTQIDLKSAAGALSVIVGHSSGAKASFVRKPGSARSLLASPQVFADPEPKNWLHRPIVDVAADRVQEVRVTMGKTSYTVTRKERSQPDFALTSAPKGKVLASDSAGNVLGTALANLELDDVRKFDPAQWPAATDRAEVRTFDGWVLGVEGRVDGEHHWIRVTSRFDEALAKGFAPPKDAKSPAPDARKDSEALSTRAVAWVYEIPKYKYDALFKPLDELTKKP
jgi:hypothetical protein